MVAVIVIVFMLSCIQYVQFKKDSAHLVELKEDYRVYTLALRKLFNQKMKEYNQDHEIDPKKKKITCAADVVSSDLSDDDDSAVTCMLLVNRDDDYLRSNALALAQKYSLQQEVAQLLDGVSWKEVKKRKIKRSLQRTKRREKTRFVAIPTGHDIAAVSEAEIEAPDFEFSWPLDRSQFWLSSLFGPRRIKNRGWRFHYGIDMAAIKGTPVRAAGAGIVVQSYWNDGGYGNCIIIAHNRKYKTRYAHLHRRFVSVGKKVQRGEIIGTVGDTGLVVKRGVSAAHLHFEVYRFDKHVNPLSVLA